ncbi:hypothetical protein ABIE58_003765 [Roseovarius sp. MBR-78]
MPSKPPSFEDSDSDFSAEGNPLRVKQSGRWYNRAVV